MGHEAQLKKEAKMYDFCISAIIQHSYPVLEHNQPIMLLPEIQKQTRNEKDSLRCQFKVPMRICSDEADNGGLNPRLTSFVCGLVDDSKFVEVVYVGKKVAGKRR